MATRIRLARAGAKKKPFYRLVATDQRSPRDGNFIEKLGTYNPLLSADNKDRFLFNKERVEYWLKTGATPSEKVAIFLWDNGIKIVEQYLPNSFPKSAAEREKIKAAKVAKAEAEAKAEADKKAKEQAEAEAEATQEAEADNTASSEAKQEDSDQS
jgi:small subunit ribosomal protein S16